MNRQHMLALLALVTVFSTLGAFLLMQRSLSTQHRFTWRSHSDQQQHAAPVETTTWRPELNQAPHMAPAQRTTWRPELNQARQVVPDLATAALRPDPDHEAEVVTDIVVGHGAPGSQNEEASGGTSSTAAAPKQDDFVPFEYDPKLDLYPWHQVHFGHWRRRMVEPGHVLADRSIQPGPEMWELSGVVQRAVKELRLRTGDDRYREQLCLGGRYRHVPGVGVQYEMYFHAADAKPEPDLGHNPGMPDWLTQAGNGDDAAANADPGESLEERAARRVQTFFHTVRLQRQTGELRVQYRGLSGGAAGGGARLVKIIVPYYRRPEALQQVLERFQKLAVQQLEDIELMVVRFSSGLPEAKEYEVLEDKTTVETMVSTMNAALGGGSPRITLVEADGSFSLAGGWLRGISSQELDNNMVVFLSHVDLVFGQEFLRRCRANSKPGESVYYPVVFSTYNPDIVYGVIKKKVIPVLDNYDKKKVIHQDLGSWLDKDYSVSCHCLSDLKRISAPLTTQLSSSLPHRIYERYLKSSIDVVRLPDRDLVQVYRRVECTRDLGRTDFNTCLKTKATNEASKLEWGLWVYKNMGDTDEVDAFLNLVKSLKNT